MGLFDRVSFLWKGFESQPRDGNKPRYERDHLEGRTRTRSQSGRDNGGYVPPPASVTYQKPKPN